MMAKPQASRNVQRAFLFGALCAIGCGGNFTAAPGGGGGASGGGGSESGSGGGGGKGACKGEYACPAIACREGSISVVEPGDCCPSCIPEGSGGSAAGTGGSMGSGGACGTVACPAIECVGSWVSLPGQCCPTCQGGSGGAGGGTGCGDVACVAYACAKGYQLVTQPGECCPTCVASADACKVGQEGYTTLLTNLLNQPGSESCQVDADCTLLQGNANCGDVCTDTPISAGMASGVSTKLNAYAASNCSTCVASYPPCAAPPPPVCVSGTCMAYHPV